jgi:hypothetical protein
MSLFQFKITALRYNPFSNNPRTPITFSRFQTVNEHIQWHNSLFSKVILKILFLDTMLLQTYTAHIAMDRF